MEVIAEKTIFGALRKKFTDKLGRDITINYFISSYFSDCWYYKRIKFRDIGFEQKPVYDEQTKNIKIEFYLHFL